MSDLVVGDTSVFDNELPVTSWVLDKVITAPAENLPTWAAIAYFATPVGWAAVGFGAANGFLLDEINHYVIHPAIGTAEMLGEITGIPDGIHSTVDEIASTMNDFAQRTVAVVEHAEPEHAEPEAGDPYQDAMCEPEPSTSPDPATGSDPYDGAMSHVDPATSPDPAISTDPYDGAMCHLDPATSAEPATHVEPHDAAASHADPVPTPDPASSADPYDGAMSHADPDPSASADPYDGAMCPVDPGAGADPGTGAY
jgi:hypothetical protein